MSAGETTEQKSGDRRRRKPLGRRPLVIGTAFALVTGVSVAGALGLGGGGSKSSSDAPRAGGSVTVTRGTLAQKTEVEGNLGHGPEAHVQVKSAGTVTWLPERDATLRRGQTLLRVDDRPVVVLYGALPMYRDLGVANADGSGDTRSGREGTDNGEASTHPDASGSGGQTATGSASARPLQGADVRQLESNLHALGYTGFTVDDTFSELTAAAVKRWQKDLGVAQTGIVKASDVVYVPGPVRVADTGVPVGSDAGGDTLAYASSSLMVTVNARAGELSWAERGNRVSVTLPDGHTVPGRVASVGKDASAGPGGGGDSGGGAGGADGGSTGGDGGGGAAGATVPVIITFSDQTAVGRIRSGPVTVRYVGAERKNVLSVPVVALVALAEGGYGLELADTGKEHSGAARYIPVKTGMFADGDVEVSGPQVHEGLKVRIPK